jgi:hypothetical protein
VNLELVSVQDEVAEAIALIDLDVDCDSAFVSKLAAKLNVVEGNGIVRGLCPVDDVVSLYLSNTCWDRI